MSRGLKLARDARNDRGFRVAVPTLGNRGLKFEKLLVVDEELEVLQFPVAVPTPVSRGLKSEDASDSGADGDWLQFPPRLAGD